MANRRTIGISIYSNDGSTELATYGPIGSDASVTIVSTGVMYGSTQIYTYTGEYEFLGLSTVAGSTVPSYAIGETRTAAHISTSYIVEGEPSKTLKSTSPEQYQVIEAGTSGLSVGDVIDSTGLSTITAPCENLLVQRIQ